MTAPLRPTSVTVGLPVSDVADAAAWYERMLGFAPQLEPAPGVVEFEVRPGVWLQLFEEGQVRPSGWAFRFGVEDLDAARARLGGLGLDVGPVERVEGVVAFCSLWDPDGNELSLYQVLA